MKKEDEEMKRMEYTNIFLSHEETKMAQNSLLRKSRIIISINLPTS